MIPIRPALTPTEKINRAPQKVSAKYCPLCQRAWQPIWGKSIKHSIEYLYDFPTIGLERIICSNCKNWKSNATN